MKRTQVQLKERTYSAIRRLAFEKGISISAVVRELLDEALGLQKASKKPVTRSFSFIGAGYSEQIDLAPVSERHDEALAQDLRKGEDA